MADPAGPSLETGAVNKSPFTETKTTEGAQPADGITGLCMAFSFFFRITNFISKADYSDPDEGNVFETTPDSRRQIGVFSAIALIFNRVVGTGIFATPSTILSLSGSVGLALFMWVIGTIIALAGTAVYLEWGTAIPR
jgi:hypothetical protein